MALHRFGARRDPRAHPVAAHLSGLRPPRAIRDDLGVQEPSRSALPQQCAFDWPGNITFAVGLSHDGRDHLRHQPYGTTTWAGRARSSSPARRRRRRSSRPSAIIETKVSDPMFRLPLFRIRAFRPEACRRLLSGIGRGGLMFMLIIWLQGIWLPSTDIHSARHLFGRASTCFR